MKDQEILEQLKQLNILTRVNNVLLSKFILQLQVVKKELHIPKLKGYWKFELLEDEYVELIKEFDRKDVDKALYNLDRGLVQNKLNCPNNIKAYIRRYLKQKELHRHERKRHQEEEREEEN